MYLTDAWESIVRSYSPDTLLTWGTIILANIVYYTFGLLLLIVDVTKRPEALVRPTLLTLCPMF